MRLTAICLFFILYARYFDLKVALPFRVVAGMLRIGRKYSIKSFIASGRDRLKTIFPTSLEDYDRLPVMSRFHLKSIVTTSLATPISILMEEEDTMEAIPLLKTFGLKHCLPAAFYALPQFGERRLFSAVAKGLLSLDICKHCTIGLVRLRQADVCGMKGIFCQELSPKCSTPEECGDGASHIAAGLLRGLLVPGSDPLQKADEWLTARDTPPGTNLQELHVSYDTDSRKESPTSLGRALGVF